MVAVARRSMVFRAVSTGAVVLVAALGLLLLLAPQHAHRVVGGVAAWIDARGGGTLTLATAGPKGCYHRLGALLAEAFREQGRYKVEPLVTAGTMDNLVRVLKGEADFALAQGGPRTDPAELAEIAGIDRDDAQLVAIANLGREYVHLLAPRGSDIYTFRDLMGKRVGVGPPHSGSEALAKEVFDFFDFAPPPQPVCVDGEGLVAAFEDGRIEAAFTVYGLFAPVVETALASGYYRLLPIPEAVAVARHLPGVFAETLPHSLYGPNRALPSPDDPFPTLAVNTLLVTRRSTPPRQVYAMLERLYSADFIREARLQGLTEARGRDVAQLPLHREAQAFYRRNAPVSSDRFEIASFFLAGLVCVASTVHYLVGRRERQRIDRRRRAIAPYFKAMLDFGHAVENASSADELTGIINQMMATQRKAERAWLAGELDTEHMDNLYSVYNIRSRNAFSKIMRFQLEGLRPEPREQADSARGRWAAEGLEAERAEPWQGAASVREGCHAEPARGPGEEEPSPPGTEHDAPNPGDDTEPSAGGDGAGPVHTRRAPSGNQVGLRAISQKKGGAAVDDDEAKGQMTLF